MNSLVSSANSTYICGLDRKVDKVLGSSTQTKRKLNYSIESSNQTKKVNYSITTTPLPIAHLLVQVHLSTLWTTPTKLQLSCLPTLVPSTICLKTPGKSSWRLKASQSYTTGKKIVSTKHCRLTATLPTLCQRLEERLVIWTGLGLFIPRLQVTINLPQKIDFVIQFQQLVVFLNQVVALRLSQKVVSTMQLDAFVEGFTKLRSVYLQNFTAARVPDVI